MTCASRCSRRRPCPDAFHFPRRFQTKFAPKPEHPMNKLLNTGIDRRHFLRGLGMALALPAFDSLNVGFAAAAPSATPRRLICIGNHLGFWPDGFFPTTERARVCDQQDAGSAAGVSFGFHRLLPSRSRREGRARRGAFVSHRREEGGVGGISGEEHLDGPSRSGACRLRRRGIPRSRPGLVEGTDMCWNRAGVRLPPVNNPARLFEALFVEASAEAKASERERSVESGQRARCVARVGEAIGQAIWTRRTAASSISI